MTPNRTATFFFTAIQIRVKILSKLITDVDKRMYLDFDFGSHLGWLSDTMLGPEK